MSDLRSSAASEIVQWSGCRLHVTFLPGTPTNVSEISSVRGIVLRSNQVLVVQNPDEEHIMPGGRIEPGESCESALCREVLEETGWEIADLLPIGNLQFHHLAPKPVGYRFPYPQFCQQVYAARALREHPNSKLPDDYERRSGFEPTVAWEQRATSIVQKAMLKAAVQAFELCANRSR